jgi:hypothetical protein
VETTFNAANASTNNNISAIPAKASQWALKIYIAGAAYHSQRADNLIGQSFSLRKGFPETNETLIQHQKSSSTSWITECHP